MNQNIDTTPFVDLLKDFEEPKYKSGSIAGQVHPYVLFGHMVNTMKGIAPSLACLKLINSHRNGTQCQNFVDSGWKLLKYSIPDPVLDAEDHYIGIRDAVTRATQGDTLRARALVAEDKANALEREIERLKNQGKNK